MRPTPAAGEAALPSSSRKSSLVGDRRPSINSAQPTSFFLAREEDVFGSSLKPQTSRRTSTSHQTDEIRTLAASQLNMASHADSGQPDSMYGVQSLEEALDQAFGHENKENEDTTSPNLAGLLKRKRRKPSSDRLEKAATAEASGDTVGSQTPSPVHHPNPLASRTSRANTLSQPLTPLQLESPIPESAMPSTPKSGSFRSLALSEEDDEATSQAITSGGEEEDEEQAAQSSIPDHRDSAPQLVMPSLSMPSRRPFTERGKQMGRLKIAVAGANGVGKTSLIRAIVRQCDDIVHLDPMTTPTPNLQTPQPGKRPKKSSSAKAHIVEIQASTKAYPPWWSDVEDSRVLRRRKSLSETVLERNISFIDAPGFETGTVLNMEEQPLIRYMEVLFHRNAAVMEMSSSDLLGVLSGAGGTQIDVVLYICSTAESISQHDFEYMSTLSRYTSVVPIITKADASPEAELQRRKDAVAHELPRCNINGSVLSKPVGQSVREDATQTPMLNQESYSSSSYLGTSPTSIQAPFLVSCLAGSDDGEMDASLLMSPSYSPPLVPSELQSLVEMLFEPETMIKLRHISARKFLFWRDRLSLQPNASPDFSTPNTVHAAGVDGLGIKDHLALARNGGIRRTSSPTGALITRHSNNNSSQASSSSPFNLSSTSVAIGSGLPDFTRARIRDHILREERLAQIQLAKWASDLQRKVRREREEYAHLVEGERARWLLERVGEEVTVGRINSWDHDDRGEEKGSWALTATMNEQQSRSRVRGRGRGLELPSWARTGSRVGAVMDVSDPLGLCVLADGAKRTGNVILKVLGGGVLVGAVWVAICRAWSIDPNRWWSLGWW